MADQSSSENTVNADRLEASLDAKVIDIAIRLGVLGLCAYFALQLVAPFFAFLLWAVILTVALYPVYSWLARKLGGRKVPSAVLITLVCLAIVIGPVAVLVISLVDTLKNAFQLFADGKLELPPLPELISGLPFIGDKIAELWGLATRSLELLFTKIGPTLLPAGEKVLSVLASISGSLLFFIVSILIAGCLFVPGPRLASGTKQLADRVIAPRGAEFVDLAAATIRNVSRGVIGVAVIQGLLTGILLIVFSVPMAGLLTFAALLLCILQIGPVVIIVPTVIWAWMSWEFVPALLFTGLILPVMVIDNFLRPILMSRGLDVPMLVILIGVFGGTLAYGLVGIFVGPVVLAVFYELVIAWVKVGEKTLISDQPAGSKRKEPVIAKHED